MKKRIIIILLLVVVVGGFAAKTFFLKSPPPKYKISGTVYILPKGFTLNMAGGRYATLSVALILAPDQSTASADAAAAAPPEGYGTLPEEPVIRDIVTNTVTGLPVADLVNPAGRDHLKSEILAQIKKTTDVKATGILFTDVAVQ